MLQIKCLSKCPYFKKPPLPCESPCYAPLIIWAANKKEVSHLRCRTANKFMNVREWMEIVGRCVCVFIFFHREGFFRLQDVQDILERYGSTILCCEYLSGCFLPSSFISISESIIFHLQRRNSSSPNNWREYEVIYWNPAKR